MKLYNAMFLIGLSAALASCADKTKPLVVHLNNPHRDTAIVINYGNDFFEQQIQLNVRSTLAHDALIETSTLIWGLKDGQSRPDCYQHTYYRIPKGKTITILQDFGDEHTVKIRPLGINEGALDLIIHLPAPVNADPKNAVGTDSLVRKPLPFSKSFQ